MYATKDGQRLYLTSWDYNALLMLDELRKVIRNNGGRVKPYRTAIISNRALEGAIHDYETRLRSYMSYSGRVGNKNLEVIAKCQSKLSELTSIHNDPIEAYGQSWICFVFDGYYYRYALDDNPLFEFYYAKTKIAPDGAYRADAQCMEDPKAWWNDCFLRCECSINDRVDAANEIFTMLTYSKASPVSRDTKRIRVHNSYDDNYHYETVLCERPRMAYIDF